MPTRKPSAIAALQTSGEADVERGAVPPDVAAVLAALEGRRAEEAQALDQLFRQVTGFAPRMWSGSILGYGRYDYRYASGRSGSFLATGFAPRMAGLSIYIMPGYADFGDLLDRLGPHKKGKACLTVRRLYAIDQAVLANLIAAGLKDLAKRWPILPA